MTPYENRKLIELQDAQWLAEKEAAAAQGLPELIQQFPAISWRVGPAGIIEGYIEGIRFLRYTKSKWTGCFYNQGRCEVLFGDSVTALLPGLNTLGWAHLTASRQLVCQFAGEVPDIPAELAPPRRSLTGDGYQEESPEEIAESFLTVATGLWGMNWRALRNSPICLSASDAAGSGIQCRIRDDLLWDVRLHGTLRYQTTGEYLAERLRSIQQFVREEATRLEKTMMWLGREK